ncbi:MAG: L,D-transpeptidase family protein [Hyphomicrobiales bacterium]|nr:L,D-transpeptidase family protein [Hyphomicrobiales bacterium]
MPKPVWQTNRRAGPAAAARSGPQPVTRKKRKAVRRSASPKRAPTNGGGWAIRTDKIPALEPETFYATAKAAERYASIADRGGWPKIPRALRRGSSGSAVAVLRQRLAIEGELPAAASNSTHWDDQLTQAVRNYQYRVGLRQTGSVTGKTLKALNISAAQRFKQLASSAHRIAGSRFPFGRRYVAVNIPSAAAEAVENGRVVRRYVVVVGDVKHRSPQVITRITHVNLNPTWTVPTSIIKNEIIPRMRRDPGYLSRSRIRILDGSGKEINPSSVNWSSNAAARYTLRQDSGRRNALGTIRIQMPNSQAVYMHDTPSKRFFRRDYRFLSHGCVRVQGVYDLAEWLLRDTPGGWSKRKINKYIGGKRRDVRLASPVPVAWIYMTGWASSNGVVHFRDDIYDVDRIGGGRTASAR